MPPHPPRVLVGDVGGTRSRFAIAERGETGIVLHGFERSLNDDFARFSDALADFASRLAKPMPDRALFALAGPPQPDGSVTLTNRDWPTIRPEHLKAAAGLESVTLVNDFAAMARAIPEMPESAFESVLEGTPKPGAPVLVTGPGTGFGISTLLPGPGGTWRVLTGEGGHAAYAAQTLREAKFAARLTAEHGYISTEAIVSGAWLQPVFDAVSDLHGQPRHPIDPADLLARAQAGDPVCAETGEIRARAIMGAAGDAALITGSQGGVVLTGGVAERIGPLLREPGAVARFRNRGARTDWMADIPVSILHASEAPLIGAAALAFDQG